MGPTTRSVPGMTLRALAGVLLVVLVACSQGDTGESSAPAPEATPTTTATTTTTTTSAVPEDAEAEVDQVIDDIAEGYDLFTSNSDDDLQTTLMGWAAASGTYQRVAENLTTQPPDPLPEHVVEGLAEALTAAGEALMAAVECAAEALEAGAGPEVCDDAFSEARTTSTMIAVRLEPAIGYGSRPYDEVLALFSS